MRVDGLIAAMDDDVIAGLDAGDLIAILALCVSIAAAALSWHNWRRAPGSTVAFRQISVGQDETGRLTFSCIAANRSPHAVELTRGHVRCRPASGPSDQGASISLGGIFSVGATARDTETRSNETGISVELGLGGISLSVGSGQDASVVAVVMEVDLVPEGGGFPATIPPSQGVPLRGAVLTDDDSVVAVIGRITFEVSTNDGLTFSEEVPMPEVVGRALQPPTTK